MLISRLFAKPPPDPKPANGCYRTPEEIQQILPEPIKSTKATLAGCLPL